MRRLRLGWGVVPEVQRLRACAKPLKRAIGEQTGFTMPELIRPLEAERMTRRRGYRSKQLALDSLRLHRRPAGRLLHLPLHALSAHAGTRILIELDGEPWISADETTHDR